MRVRSVVVGFVVTLAAAVIGYFVAIRPWHMRWGATDEEIDRPMPGDELVSSPQVVLNHAIGIDASLEEVWPWLVQMGEGRGGFYSYDWIENLMGMEIRSADRILPEFQRLEPGDIIPAGEIGIPVFAVEPNQYLVLGASEEFADIQASWSIGLYPEADDSTRVISRTRYRYITWSPIAVFYFVISDPGIFIMVRKWLYGLKERAESQQKF